LFAFARGKLNNDMIKSFVETKLLLCYNTKCIVVTEDNMNVIVSNKQKQVLDNANIDAIKELNGLFKVDDLIINFKNYFFTKMVVDATSIVEFANPNVLKRLAEGIGAEKLVILLPSKPEPPRKFLKLLITLGIYNFSSNINDIVNFVQNPNTYDDVKEYLEETVSNNFYQTNNNFDNSNNYDVDHDINDNYMDDSYNESDNTLNTVHNYLNSYDGDYQENNSFGMEVANNNFIGNNFNDDNKYILGIKNVTNHAGTTTLIYMLKNTLEHIFNKKVLALEFKTRDFTYFRSQSMLSVTEDNLESTIKNSDCDIILLDLNNNDYVSLCNDIIYLVEPSIISVNRLISENRMAFASLKDKKVVLNKSLISNDDVNKFSQEAGISFYYVIPALNDRVGNSIIENFVNKLGL